MSKQSREARKRRRQSMSRGRRVLSAALGWLSGLLVIAAMALGGVLIWQSMQPEESAEAPVPAQDFVQDTGEPVGPTEAPVDDSGVAMTPADMAPGTLFIPAIGAYSPIVAEDGFEASKYAGFDSMEIPVDNSKSGWYSPGGALYGGDQGTTLLASHVTSHGYGWGVLQDLYSLQGGEMLYTKDFDGNLQSWQMTEMRTEFHTDFPQDYWAADGERRLVVTTCGGGLTEWGTYQYNIFTVAVPVDPKPRTPLAQALATLPERMTVWHDSMVKAAAEQALLDADESAAESGAEDAPDGESSDGLILPSE